jgi:hypothetical protein
MIDRQRCEWSLLLPCSYPYPRHLSYAIIPSLSTHLPQSPLPLYLTSNALFPKDRCHRIGQTRAVRVFRLVTMDTVDEDIYEMGEQQYPYERPF